MFGKSFEKYKDLINKKSILSFEKYSALVGIDNSIFKLNPLIKGYGYEFVFLNLSVIEKDFANFFIENYKEEMYPKTKFKFDNFLSTNLALKIQKNHTFWRQLCENEGIILLKKIDDILGITSEEAGCSQKSEMNLEDINKFSNNLITTLRLCKMGEIHLNSCFLVNKETRHVRIRLESKIIKNPNSNFYRVLDDDISEILSFIEVEKLINPFNSLALINFNLSYKSEEMEIKFLKLMISLESLFNQGRDQITHIFARHLALIISNSKQDFTTNYKRIKKMYNIRSSIVHGSTVKENLLEKHAELENFVRIGLKFCLKSGLSKADLFETLNSSGFSS